jgi:hypothetical protein
MVCSYPIDVHSTSVLRILICSLSPERLQCLKVMLADVAVIVRRRKATLT